MSSPQPTPAATAKEKSSRRKSVQRFFSKIIRPGKSKEPESAAAAAPAAESSSAAAADAPPAPAAADASSPVATPAPVATAPAAEPEEACAPTKTTTPKTAPLSAGARQLAEKHGIDIPEDWPYPAKHPIGERVEKPIRMRVRRYCHVCQASFGSEKACPSCSHKRCVECPRSPAAKPKHKKPYKHKEPEPYEGISIPAKPAGQDLVYRKIRQRVHYKCHKCEADFAGQKTCPGCSHNCCKRCQRTPSRKPLPEPPKRKKAGRWKCSECHTGGNFARSCSTCSHSRCVDCTREKLKKKAPAMVIGDTGTDTDIANIAGALASTSIS